MRTVHRASRRRPSRGARGRCCSPPAPGAARRRCSSSASRARCWTTACAPGRSWPSRSPRRRRASCAPASARASSSSASARRRARPRAPGSGRSTASARASCAGTPSPPAWTRPSWCSTRPIARELRATAWRRAFAAWIDDGGDAARGRRRRLRRRPPGGRDRRASTTRCAARGRRGPSLPAPRRHAGRSRRRATRWSGRCRAAQAELAAAKPGARVAAALDAVLAGARRFPTYKMEALCGSGCTAYREAVERARACAERDGARPRSRPRSSTSCSTATPTAFAEAKAARSGLDFDDLAALRARPPRAATRRSARPTRSASRASWSTSSRTRTRSRSSSSTSSRRAARSSSATSSSRSTGSVTRTSRSSAHARASSPRAARPRRCARTSARARRSSRRSTPRSGRASASGFMALLPGREDRAGGRAASWSCCSPTPTGWDDVDLGGLPPAPGVAPRRGAAARPADRRARRDRRRRARGRRRAPARRRLAAGLRARAAGRRAADARGRRARLLGPPGRPRPLRLARRPRQPARRGRALRRARLAARRRVDRRARARRRGRPGPAGRAWQAIAERSSRAGTRELAAPARARATASACARSRCASTAERRRRAAPRARRAARAHRRRPRDYDLHVLSLPNGERRLANVHKLQRLAAEHEREHGRDVRAFVDLANAELEAEAREADAPVELGDAPRRAAHDDPRRQGAGVRRRRASPTSAAASPPTPTTCSWPTGRLGLRLVGLDGSSEPALQYPALRERAMAAAAAEEAADRLRRADARAGAAHRQRRAARREVARPDGPDRAADRLARARARAGHRRRRSPEQPVREVAWTTPGGERAARPRDVSTPGGPRPGAAPRRAPAGAAEDLPVAIPPVLGAPARSRLAPPGPPATLSYTALRALEACGYRFYLERVLGPAARGRAATAGRRRAARPRRASTC